ncbi:MAG TPA: MotA/TolQ/ExbB proton channel family protein [Planctomycetota bacterium]|nr:MotA/TolQ/ExbB proton channel family protein [Planctomycetota bacterium]
MIATFTTVLAAGLRAGIALAGVVQAPQAPPASSAATTNVLLDMFENAGLVGYVIVALSVVALAMVIENLVAIKRDKLAPADLIDTIENLFNDGNHAAAVELCAQERNYLTNCVGAGLARLGHPFATVLTAIREAETIEAVRLFQKIGWLSMLSAVAPLLGLFGTVTGMFITFGAITAAGGSVAPAQLAGGIKIALVTTIFGLTVAIPVGLFYFVLRNRVINCCTEVNAVVEDLFERFRGKPEAVS